MPEECKNKMKETRNKGKALIGVYFLKYEDAEKYGKSRAKLIPDWDYQVLPMQDRGFICVSRKQAEWCGIG